MIDRRTGKLAVFENFVVDRKLPKFDETREPPSTTYVTSGTFEVAVGRDGDALTVNPFNSTFTDGKRRRSVFVAMIQRIVSLLLFWKRRETITIERFFSAVKGSAKNIEIVKERAEGYGREIVRARRTGQTALMEKLVGGLNAYRMETALLSAGFPKYLDEEDLIYFHGRTERGLRLDWVKNFVRRIPDEVLEAKARADEIGAFDNYVVLHYDPERGSVAETKEEELRRKDPILFGLMRDRRRLYFVGDWTDEYCDLTLDQIADVIGQEKVKNLTDDAP